ncbi:hypothetical protein ABIA54_001778 [Pseudomonas sp. EB276 TE3739]|nr:hypothetical protein [Pseudomonas koreensis]
MQSCHSFISQSSRIAHVCNPHRIVSANSLLTVV